MSDTHVGERRKSPRPCRLSAQTQRFIIFWPLLASWPYTVTALWGFPLFGDGADTAYRIVSLAVAFMGILATMFWEAPMLRILMASTALARSFSAIVFGLFSQPQLPLPALMRISSNVILAIIFFGLALVETPYLKAMKRELK